MDRIQYAIDRWNEIHYRSKSPVFSIPACVEVLPKLPDDIHILHITVDIRASSILRGITQLPSDLEELYCAKLGTLEYIAHFPPSLKKIYVNENALRTVPPLPDGLLELHCYKNPLESLPILPNSLEELWCECVNIKELPNIPMNLKVLVGCGEICGLDEDDPDKNEERYPYTYISYRNPIDWDDIW